MEIIERLATLEAEIKTVQTRLNKFDEERTWLVRVVLGIIIAAVMGLVLTNGGA